MRTGLNCRAFRWACGLILAPGLVWVAWADSPLLDIRPKDLQGEKQKADGKEEPKPELIGGDENEDEATHARLAREGEATLQEINKLLEEIQKNLANKDTSSGTQEKQKQSVERLEKLIKELQDHQKG